MIASTFTTIALEQLQDLSNNCTGGAHSTLILVPIIQVITGTSGKVGSHSAPPVLRGLLIGDIANKESKP